MDQELLEDIQKFKAAAEKWLMGQPVPFGKNSHQQEPQQTVPDTSKSLATVRNLEATVHPAKMTPMESVPAGVATDTVPTGSGDTMLVSVMFGVLLAFDVLTPFAEYKLSNHLRSMAFMVMASAVFCAFVSSHKGEAAGVAWATGYALEWALSMDNLFVFHLVFKAFSVPNEHAMQALRLGIYGAIFFRVIFIVFLTHLLELSLWVNVALGCVLILSGILSLQDDDDDDEVQNMPTVRFFKWLAGPRLLDTYREDGCFLVREDGGQLQMTVLFLVVCVIAVVDCIFAVDSVGAKTGEIKSIYINLTSSLMGMFSLRSLFFIVRDMAEYFDYVKYGICSILCFVGAKMLISKWVEVPLRWSCAIVCIMFATSVLASIVKVLKVVGNGRGPIQSLTIWHESRKNARRPSQTLTIWHESKKSPDKDPNDSCPETSHPKVIDGIFDDCLANVKSVTSASSK